MRTFEEGAVSEILFYLQERQKITRRGIENGLKWQEALDSLQAVQRYIERRRKQGWKTK